MSRIGGESGLMLVVLAGISFGTACGYRKLGPDSGMEGADGGGTDHVAAADSGIDSKSFDGRTADAVADHAAFVDVGGGSDVAVVVDAPPDRPSDSTPADAPRDNVPDQGIAIDSGPPQLGNGSPCQSNPQCFSNNCSGSVCCAAGQTGCSGACYDLSRDNAHCGTCTRACALGQETCVGSACQLDDGQPCTTASQCVSGICTMFYVDADGDHYGTAAQTGFCTITAPPAGYAAATGDCCDSNAGVSPGIGAGVWFVGPAPVCPGGTMISQWDYDCSGVVETQFPNAICGPPPACAATRVNYPESRCGQFDVLACDTQNCVSQAGMSCAPGCAGPFGQMGCH